MTALLEEMTTRIDSRMEELQPLVQEYGELAEAKARLTGREVNVSLSPARRRGRPSAKDGSAPRAGKRTDMVIAYLREHPDGATVNQIVEGTGTSLNYTYAIVRDLVDAEPPVAKRAEGRVVLIDPNYRSPSEDENKGDEGNSDGDSTQGEQKPDETPAPDKAKPAARARATSRK
jgi:hypothetical protein